MSSKTNAPNIPLPISWPATVKSAMLHVITLAQLAVAYTRSWSSNSPNERIRFKARCEQLEDQLVVVTEQLRILIVRMAQIDPYNRPRYPPTERMAILQLRAGQGWSLKETARRFLLAPATIASWTRRVDEDGPDALVQLREPVNKFPDFLRYAIQQLKAVCPSMGKGKIAGMLCRTGLHLGKTTIGRILKENPVPPPELANGNVSADADLQTEAYDASEPAERIVKAKYPNHVWHMDLTAVPIFGGFWTSWFPFTLPQVCPFCWWVAVVVDHYSRRVMNFTIFRKLPTARAVENFLERTIQKNGAKPKYIISDKGKQFWCNAYKAWCKLKNIKPRFGAVGKSGSIAVVERFIRTLKSECTRQICVPLRRRDFRAELAWFVEWFNEYRPHTFLNGRTPNEAFYQRHPKCRHPRFEPRVRWPRGSPCASPRVPVKGKPGVRLVLHVAYHAGRKHLPIVTLRRAA